MALKSRNYRCSLARFFFKITGNVTATFVLFNLISCTSIVIPSEIELVLNKTKNKSELKKVINHFRNDSLKLKATYYLIKNMDGLQTLDTMVVSDNDKYFDVIQTKWSFKDDKPKNNVKIFASVIDSINKALDLDPRSITPEYLRDIDIISSDFLIKNIELAFEVWRNNPWSKNIDFDTFCEFILPYRCTPTYSDNTRTFFINHFNNNDSLKKVKNPIQAGSIITNSIDKWFLNNTMIFAKYPYLHPIKFSNLLKGKIGECYDQNALMTGALRSLGIPTAFDEIPNWASQNNRHYWYKIIDPKNDTVKSLITNKNVPVNTQHIISGSSFRLTKVFKGIPESVELHYTRTIPKVYRQSFKKETRSLASIEESMDSIPEYFRNTKLKDVTKQYVDCSDVRLSGKFLEHKYLYLCVFNNRNWIPISWSKPINNTAEFKSMGKNIVYLPGYYVKGDIVPAGTPFILTLDGKIKQLKPKTRNMQMQVYTKYPYRMLVHDWQSKTIGGKFQFANDSNFTDSINIYTVKELPFYRQTVDVKRKNKYRFLTFQYPNNSVFIAEIDFYGLNKKGKEVLLKGEVIGNEGSQLVFDGNVLTYYNGKKGHGKPYIGIDLGEGNATQITKIRYTPRGDDNAIREGETYELYYWDNNWVKLTSATAKTDNKIEFKSVPVNALFLLKNIKGGTENRIFSYENKKQIFW